MDKTGNEHSLYLVLEHVVNVRIMGYSWSRDQHGLPQPVGYALSAISRTLPRKYDIDSLWVIDLETKLAATSVRCKRFEDTLTITTPNTPHQPNQKCWRLGNTVTYDTGEPQCDGQIFTNPNFITEAYH